MKSSCQGISKLTCFQTFRITLTFFAACLIVWGLIHVKNTYDETVAIEKVRKLGGIVYTDGAFIDRLTSKCPIMYVDLSKAVISDEDLLLLENLPEFDCLNLEGLEITDRAIPYISRLHSLTLLCVKGTQISKDGQRKLSELLPDCNIYREINAQ